MSQQVTVTISQCDIVNDPVSGTNTVSAEGTNANGSTLQLAPFKMYAHQVPLLQAGIVKWFQQYQTNHADGSAPTKEEVAQLLTMGFLILESPAPAPQPQEPVTTTAPDFSVTATI